MKFLEAKHLKENEKVLIIEKSGKHPTYKPEYVMEISIDNKDVFVRCADGKLYHHTALKKCN